MGHMVAPRLLV